jgi:putative transposase
MVYQAARNAHPERWSGATRNWDWISQVQLNPDRDLPISQDEERLAA